MQQTKFNFLKFGYYNLQVCQFILRFNKLEMQNDERDNKNGNRKNEESRIKRIVTVSHRGSEKKAEGKYNKIYKSGSRKKDKCKRKKTEKSGYD